jgi:hypothetical protein
MADQNAGSCAEDGVSMTPSMHLSALVLSFSDRPDAESIKLALDTAFSLGHSFGIERAADVVDQCNREGPYNAIGAAKRIRSLQVVEVWNIFARWKWGWRSGMVVDPIAQLAIREERMTAALQHLCAPIPSTRGMGPKDRAQRLHAELERRIGIATKALDTKDNTPGA